MTVKPPLPAEALTEEFGSIGPSADRLRLVGLDHATRLQAGRLGAAKRRLALAQARRPEETVEAERLQAALETERRAGGALGGAVVRAEIDRAEPSAEAGIVHGLLLGDPKLIAAMLTVAAIRADGSVRRFTCADAKGYFRMNLPSEDDGNAPIFLQVSDADQAVLYRGDEAIEANSGAVVYRQITLSGDRLPPCPIPPDKATMLRLLDLPESAALAALTRLGLELGIRTTQAAPGREGLVISQEPPAGQPVDASTRVALVIGVTPDADSVVVPNVIGLAQDKAEAALKQLGLAIGDVIQQSSPKSPGTIIAQSPPPGVRVPPNASVALTVAVAPPDDRIDTPDLIGKGQEDASKTLEELGLGVGRITFRDDDRVGLVVAQSPEPGTPVAPATAVNLTIGRKAAPDTTRTPNLIGRSAAAAREILAAAKLEVGQVAGPARGFVATQKPAAGTTIPLGSSVDFRLAPRDDPGVGPVIRRDETSGFVGRIAARAAEGEDLEKFGLTEARLRAILVEADVGSKAALDRVVALENGQIREMFRLENLNQARSLRRILRDAAKLETQP